MRTSRAVLLSSLLLAAAALRGQEVPIVVANLAPAPRGSGWATVVVPAAALPRPPIAVAGRSAWRAVCGDAWGPRGRLVHVRYAGLGPHEHARVDLVASGADPSPEAAPEAPAAMLAPAVVPTLVVRVGDARRRLAMLGGAADVPEAAWRTVIHGWGRVPETMLVAHWWYYLIPGSRSVGLEVVVANSDPRSPAFVQPVDGVALETPTGIWPVLDYHARRGGRPLVAAGGGVVTPLVDWPTWLGDGQAFAWRGRLLLTDGATAEEMADLAPDVLAPVVAMALPSAWAGQWGPWGELPLLHPHEATVARGEGQRGVVELYLRHASKAGRPAEHPSGPIFADADWGNGWLPPMTGDHGDFGVTKMAPALSPPGGGPSHLHDVGNAVLYEWLRPSYWYELDGNPLRVDDHPRMVTWGLKNHWHVGVSPDRLGKGIGPGDTSNAVEFQDWAHMSVGSIVGWCQLAGSHMGRQLLQQVASGWLLGSRVDRGLSEPRGWGRTMQAMAWIWCVTGDQRVLDRLRERWDKCFDEYLAREEHAVAPFGIYPPDPRKLDGEVPFYLPWQEHLALTGFDAAYLVCYAQPGDDVGKAKARRTCVAMAKTIVRHGWWLHKGRWTTGDAIWYDEGRALPPAAYDDPARVSPHWPGTDHDRSGSGALAIARRWLVDAGEIELVGKCDAILAALDAWYRSDDGQDQPFTRYSEWRAAR